MQFISKFLSFSVQIICFSQRMCQILNTHSGRINFKDDQCIFWGIPCYVTWIHSTITSSLTGPNIYNRTSSKLVNHLDFAASLTFLCIKFSLLQKGSGLFAILPAPKNLSVKEKKRPLVPHVLTKKTPSITPAASIFKSETDDSIKNGSSLINYEDSEEESDGEGDFFALKMHHEVEGVNCAHTTKSVTSVMADSGSGTNDSIPANKGDALKSSDEPLTLNSEFNPSLLASGPSHSGHEVYEQWQNDKEPTTQTYGSSDDYISVQQEDLQLDDEAVRCISTV
jgi:hypothetical protein